MFKIKKCHRILIISLPFAFADELNRVYDLNGNLVSGDGYYKEYNELNQLVRIRQGNLSSSPVLEEFTWAPTEERILVKDVFSNGVKNYTIYYVSKDYLVIENSTGNYTEKYVYQGDQLVAQVDTGGNKQFIHSDNKGSSSLITDINGNVVENNFYSPMGELLNGGAKSRLQFEAKEIDSLTKLYDFHFRMYNSQRLPFEQPDSLIKNVYDPQIWRFWKSL